MEIRQGNTQEIGKFQLFDAGNDGEEILVVELDGKIVAYAQVTGHIIYFLESEARGAGSALVSYLKAREGYLVAKAVEETAKGFWMKQGFQFQVADGFGGEDWDWDWE